jgi:hypothetical protein
MRVASLMKRNVLCTTCNRRRVFQWMIGLLLCMCSWGVQLFVVCIWRSPFPSCAKHFTFNHCGGGAGHYLVAIMHLFDVALPHIFFTVFLLVLNSTIIQISCSLL